MNPYSKKYSNNLEIGTAFYVERKEVIIIRGRKKSPEVKISDLPELKNRIRKVKQRKSGIYKHWRKEGETVVDRFKDYWK